MKFDESLGVIHSVVSGMQSEQQARDFVSDLRGQIEVARERSGRVLHLVEAQDASVQSKSTSDILTGLASAGTLGVEKIAIVLDSALLKMQAQRLFGNLPIAMFSRRDDALEWLRAG